MTSKAILDFVIWVELPAKFSLLHKLFDLTARILRSAAPVILCMTFKVPGVEVIKIVIEFNFKSLFHCIKLMT